MPIREFCICWRCVRSCYAEEGSECEKCGEPLRDPRTFSFADYVEEQRLKLEDIPTARVQGAHSASFVKSILG